MKKSFFILSLIVLCSLQSGLLAKESVIQRPANLKSQPGEVPENDQFYEGDQGLWPKLKSASKGAVMPAADVAILMKNIEVIHFENEDGILCCGRLNLTNSTITSEAIKSNGTSVLVASNYGQGRAVVLASHLLFEEKTLLSSKNWVFLLRNTIRYAAKTSYAKYEILALGINPSRSFKDLLNRSGLVANITFVWDLNNFPTLSKSQFQVILIGEYSLEFLKATDYQKITQYVTSGGGIITTYRPECQECYIQQTSCPQLNRKCLHNTFLNPMGIKLLDGRSGGMVSTRSLQYNITDKANLTTVILRKYEKRNTTMDTSSIFYGDYNTIVAGISNISYPESSFSSFLYSQQSYFPVIENGNKQAVMLGGRFGKGKLFFCGDQTIFQKTEAVNIKFFSNIVKWLSGNKTALKVGILFDTNINQYKALQKVNGSITKSLVSKVADIQGKDILFITYYSNWPANLTAEMLAALTSFVRNGGSILLGSCGWPWRSDGEGSRNPNLVYELNFATYVIAKQFDIYLKEDSSQIPDPYIVYQNVRQTDIQNFLKNDFLNVLKGRTAFTSSNTKVDEYISRIQGGRNISVFCDIAFYHSLVDAFIQSRFNIQVNYDVIPPNDVFYQRVYKIINLISYLVPPSQCRALPPSLNVFPGFATKIISNKTVNVYKNRNQRVYTGLYINPGEPIRITHNNSILNILDVSVIINHGDDLLVALQNNGNLRRFPHVVKQFRIRSRNMTISSPHGGIIFFRVERLSNLATPLSFQIYGAYQAPYFNENMHTSNQFSQIRLIDAPLFVFQTKKLVLIGPTEGIFGSIIINLPKLCNYWTNVVEKCKQYRGISLSPFKKDSIYNDVNLRRGNMHSGNPITAFKGDPLLQFLGWKNIIFTKGHRVYHQFGHNLQDIKWRTLAITQITTEIYLLYLLYAINGIDITDWLQKFDIRGDLANFQQQLSKGKEGRDHSLFDLNYRIGTYFYYILIDDFGFQIFSTLHRRYDAIEGILQNDVDKYDLMVEQLSLVVQQNLWNYFYNWDVPVTQRSKDKVSHLPDYYCSRHPQLTP